MGQGHRQFADEFKRESMALLTSSGRPLTQIAAELGIAPSMLRIPPWTRRRRSPGFAARTIGCAWSATF